MNVFKIAWRSLQHRGLGSVLTVVSMALGVMMVVAVLSIHGLVAKSFRSNNSFGYSVIVGARGGGMQLTLNSVFYLSNPVENIPYEYYLAFCDAETRAVEMQHSFAAQALDLEVATLETMAQLCTGTNSLAEELSQSLFPRIHQSASESEMKIGRKGLYKKYTETAIPLCLGDYWEADEEISFRCVGTKPAFFTELVLDLDTNKKFQFKEGRSFREFDEENGYHECVVGAVVAKRGNVKLGQKLQATHGDPSADGSHLHEQGFTVVGILEGTGTPHDRAVFLNMEGFFLMEGHVKPVESSNLLKTEDDEEAPDFANVDPFADDVDEDTIENADGNAVDEAFVENAEQESSVSAETPDSEDDGIDLKSDNPNRNPALRRIPLPIEQREVTSILIRTSLNDEFGMLPTFLPLQINQGDLETTLDWSAYRPVKSQKAAQAVNPVNEVASLFELFVNPIRWLLLALTVMICVVSAISILVGIYNSMNQRQHEIAVMRALGANRFKVMSIMLIEAILLACLGGFVGWFAGHGLNVAISPIVEARTGVGIGFFEIAPGVPIFGYIFGGGASFIPNWLLNLPVSPELLLIPGLIGLAVLVGTYPAISAYRTDVANSLGK